MILRRAILLACGITGLAAAAGVAVIALAFALYAALLPSLGPALAAACVAGTVVMLMLMGAMIALFIAYPKRRTVKAEDPDLTSRLFGLASDKPLIAAAAILVVGFLATRNPKITASLVGILMTRLTPKKR